MKKMGFTLHADIQKTSSLPDQCRVSTKVTLNTCQHYVAMPMPCHHSYPPPPRTRTSAWSEVATVRVKSGKFWTLCGRSGPMTTYPHTGWAHNTHHFTHMRCSHLPPLPSPTPPPTHTSTNKEAGTHKSVRIKHTCTHNTHIQTQHTDKHHTHVHTSCAHTYTHVATHKLT